MAEILWHGEKGRRLFQQHLTLLLHAHDCAKREQTLKFVGMVAPNCGYPHCDTMKQMLKHLNVCTAAENNCTVAHCSSYRKMIHHWQSCNTPCTLCGPKLSKHQAKSNQKPRSAVFRKDFESLFSPLNMCVRYGALTTLRKQIIDNIVNSLFPKLEIFALPRPFIVPSLQHQIGQKLVNAILPSKQSLRRVVGDPKAIVIALCYDYATKIEDDIFEYTESFDEYNDEIANESVDEFNRQIKYLLKSSVIFPKSPNLRKLFISLGYRPLYQPALVHLKNAFAALGLPFNPATTFEPKPNWRDQRSYAFRSTILHKFMTSYPHVPITRRAKFQIDSKNVEFRMYNRAKSFEEYCFLMSSELSRMHAWAINESKRCLRHHQPYALEAPN